MRRLRPSGAAACDGRDTGRVVPWLVALVVVVGAATGLGYYYGALDWVRCGGTCTTSEVAPPRGLDLPAARAVEPVLRPAQGPGLDRAKVEAAVAGLLGSRALGSRVGFTVRDLAAEQDVYTYRRGGTTFAPASTLKILTSAAALAAVGPQTRFATTVRRLDAPAASPSGTPSAPSSATPPTAPATPATTARIALVGGGDPLLVTREQREDRSYPRDRATLAALATSTAEALRAEGVTSVVLGYDDTLFTGPGDSPRWEPQYVAGNVATSVSALWTDEGLLTDEGLRSRTPALDAARTFARLLAARGVAVAAGDPARTPAGDGASEVARVVGPTVEQVVQHLLETSDNESAEVMLRQVAIAEGRPASFDGGAAAVRAVLTRLGVPWDGTSVVDGSGLSRDNRVTTQALMGVLGLAAATPGAEPDPETEALRGVLSGLPVAGFSGSLADRFVVAGSDSGLGLVRAKTGTLSGVHSLAGVTVDADGTPLAFVAMTDAVRLPRTLDARAQLDRLAAALSACACSTG